MAGLIKKQILKHLSRSVFTLSPQVTPGLSPNPGYILTRGYLLTRVKPQPGRLRATLYIFHVFSRIDEVETSANLLTSGANLLTSGANLLTSP